MNLYSIPHIIYIVLTFVCLAAAILVFLFVLKTDKARDIFIRCIGGLLAFSLIFNRIAMAAMYDEGLGVRAAIPNTYCGLTSLLLGLVVLFGKRNMKVFHFMFYVQLTGGIATLFYPDFVNQNPSFFFLPTITGMNHHACGLILCVMLVVGKWFRPSLKNWYVFPIGLSAYTIYGLFLLDVLEIPKTMSIDAPLIPGTPLTWWFILIGGTAVIAAVAFVYEIIKALITKNNAKQTASVNSENTEIAVENNSHCD